MKRFFTQTFSTSDDWLTNYVLLLAYLIGLYLGRYLFNWHWYVILPVSLFMGYAIATAANRLHQHILIKGEDRILDLMIKELRKVDDAGA